MLTDRPLLSVSIVSHGQLALAEALLRDLAPVTLPLEILLTLNVPEDARLPSHPALRITRNTAARGFAANHNAAFQLARGEFFCVLNPDVRLRAEVFEPLVERLRADPRLGVVAPRVLSPDVAVEDTARRFPTAWSLLLKLFGVERRMAIAARDMAYPDWVAGMFMLFPRQVFQQAGGFDPGYFLYYEDADLCARLRKLGYRVGYCAELSIVHDAQRTSRRNPRYLRWHLSSMLRFLVRRALGRL